MKKKKKEIGTIINSIGSNALRVIGTAMMTFLVVYAFVYSVDVKPLGNEISSITRDFIPGNIASVVVFTGICILVSVIGHKLSKRTTGIIAYVMLGLTMAAVMAEGMWWVCSVDHAPQGDQLNLYAYSSYMMDGNYVFLEQANYFGMYPHQLGLAAIMEILFSVTGPLNYHAFQVINVLFSVGIVFFGFRIVRHFTEELAAAFVYCAAMVFCVPLVGYTQWVYGEIPSIFFLLVAAFYLIKCNEKFKWGYAAAVILATGISCLYRKNSLIFLIAVCICLIFKFFKEFKSKYLITAALVIVLPILLYNGIYMYYGKASGMEISDGLPSSSWIAMGLSDESECGPGGYVNVIDDYRENNCDTKVLDANAKAKIKERLEYFKSNPVYAAKFFKDKITYYWNNPTYQSVYFGSIFCINGDMPDNRLFCELSFGRMYDFIFEYCNILQLIVWVGTMLYCLLAVDSRRNMPDYVLIITVIGGFLFSLFWEGKARYVLPYYIMMIPLCAIGYTSAIRRFYPGEVRKNSEENDD